IISSIADRIFLRAVAFCFRIESFSKLRCCFCVLALIRFLQGAAQLQLKNSYGQIADASVTEGARARVEDGRQRGVLRDGFGSSVRVAGDAKRALGPAEHAIGLAGALP